MGYVSDAFGNLKSALEITKTEQDLASSRRQAIYDHVFLHWAITSAFLTGSYDRHTKTKKLKDVDIFVVIDPDGAQAGLRLQAPSAVLASLKAILELKYPGKVTIDGMACVISFGSEDIMSFEVVPAFERKGGGYEIPDVTTASWISTDPSKHAKAATAKNAACDSKWIPFVKMVKGINREDDEPIQPSFLIEVMALDMIREPFGRYQDEIATFCASAADQIENDWADPAHLGPAVNGSISASDRSAASKRLREWQRIAEEAIDLEDAASERAAVEKWRELFGGRMPRPTG
jgi:predicted nucleotidyltransferase